MLYWTNNRAAFDSVADSQYIISLHVNCGMLLAPENGTIENMQSISMLRYSSDATQEMFQLGGGVLLVYHQMEYQQWASGPQTLLTLCAMVRYDKCELYGVTYYAINLLCVRP